MSAQDEDLFGNAFDSYMLRLQQALLPWDKDGSLERKIDSAQEQGGLEVGTAAFLHDCRRLRNLRQHASPGTGGARFAAPAHAVLHRLQAIVLDLEGVTERVRKSTPPRVFEPDDSLMHALSVMRANDFSQVPVAQEGTALLMTLVGIARWVEEQADQQHGILDVEHAKVGDVMAHEDRQHVDWIRIGAAYPDLAARMVDQAAHGRRVFAFLVTANGRPDGDILGIVTPWDIFPKTRPGD